MANPITVGLKYVSSTLRSFYVRNSSGTELAVFDTDGSLYQGGTAITATAAEMNLLSGIGKTAAELALINVHTVCTRYTTAQINAGQILINPTATGKWKVIDVKLRAIGGAATANTSVDITEETSGTIVFSAPVAGLTQNAWNVVTTANVVSTNVGVESVAGKDLLIANVGTAMATATHMDVIVTYINSVA